MYRISVLPVVAISSLCSLPTAFAQENSNSPALDEVVVTATKRPSTEFNVPLSIETISGDVIARENISALEDLATRIPNLNIANGDQVTRVSIRGLGTGNDRSFEQSVAMFIDGVYMPRSRQYRAPFFDMERVEVLRGPQAVLHGLNATAGTILISSGTTRAGDAGHMSIAAGYESEYSGYFGELIAGTSVGESLGLRIAARFNDSGDGYFRNAITNELENTSEETLVRLSADWAVSDTWNITGKVFYADAKESGNYGEQVYSDLTPPFDETGAGATGLVVDSAYDWVRYTDNVATDIIGSNTGLDHEITNASISSDWELGNGTLTALLSYSESNYVQVYNVDAMASSPGNPSGLEELLGQVLGNLVDETYEQTALELRYASDADRTISYIAGIYADDTKLVNSLDGWAGVLLGGTAAGGLGVGSQQAQTQDSSLISPYVSATWNVSDRFRLTGGVRYSRQTKDYARDNFACQNYLNELIAPASAFGTTAGPGGWYVFGDLTGSGQTLCGTLPGLRLDRTSENVMPELIAQFDVSDTSTLYAKIGQSAKSGGFNFSATLGRVEDAEYDDEEALGFELGYKGRLIDDRLSLNLALFHNEFTDLQVSSFVTPPGSPPILVISNAGESTSQGIEAELNFAATDWLIVGTSVAWLDSTYDVYEGAPCNFIETAAGETDCSKSGQETPYAPEYSGSAYADLAVPVGRSLVLQAGAVMSFSDSFFTDAALNPAGLQDSYQKWDARIGIGNADDTWSISLVGKNLTDEKILGYTLPFAGLIGYIQAPRTMWAQARFNF